MKRIFTYMTMLVMAVACEELYGPEPTPIAPDTAAGVEITVSDVKDSSFVVTVTPSAAASYYSWLVEESDTPAALDSAALYSVSYEDVMQGTAKWTAEATSTTFTVKGLAPNTTYQVYAVAGSPLGIPGSVSVKTVTTTDGLAPGYVSVETKAHQVVFTFSENVARDAAAGAIKAPYYAPYSDDFDKNAASVGEMTVPEDSILVAGNQALIAVPDLPTGCYWTISIPEGAFVDAVGQKLPAYSSTFVMVEGEKGPEPAPKGFYGKIEYVELPMLDTLKVSTFTEWDAGFAIPLLNKYPLSGFSSKKFVTVSYEKTTGSVVEKMTYTLAPEADYNITTLGLVVNLPEEPELGADVTISVPAGAFYDIYGNDCEEWEHVMKYSYGYTLEDVVGTYDVNATSYWMGPAVSTMTIEKVTDKEALELGNVAITELMGIKANVDPIYATFDVDAGTLTVADWQHCLNTMDYVLDEEYNPVIGEDGKPVLQELDVLFTTNSTEGEPLVLKMPESGVLGEPSIWFGFYGFWEVDGEGYYDMYVDFSAKKKEAAETPAVAGTETYTGATPKTSGRVVLR